ncbi:MAG: hypothetical protein ABEH65_02810 [Halobacteriales archaeon]
MGATLHRRAQLAAASIALGVLLGAPQALSSLSQYSSFPFPNPLIFTPIVGVLLYWWTEGISESIGVFIVSSLVGLLVVIVAISIPVFVLDASAAGRGALYQLGIFSAITSILPALPIVAITTGLASVIDTEIGLMRRYHPRGEATARLIGVTVGLAIITAILVGVVGANYASVAAQSQATATIVGVDVSEDGVQIGVRIPNRLRSAMYVQSIFLDFRVNGTQPIRSSFLPRTTIQPGETRTFAVPVEKLSPAAYRNAQSIRISGVVRFRAFRGYASDLPIRPWTPEN